MTQPLTVHLDTPAPGVPTPEQRIALFRSHPRRLFLSGLVLVAVAGAFGYFYDNLPDQVEDWMLAAASALVVVCFALLPLLFWLASSYIVTTERVIVRHGIFRRHYQEIWHAHGYAIRHRRGVIQRVWRCGTLTLSNERVEKLVLRNISHSALVEETLMDQVEIAQILVQRKGGP